MQKELARPITVMTLLTLGAAAAGARVERRAHRFTAGGSHRASPTRE
jgi:hypothetical protein